MRLSQPIRPYTSVRVNWTRRELVFVNEPLPVANKTRSGEVIGLDRGVVHTAADDRGGFYDAPDTAALDKQRKFHQRRMAKSKLIAARQGRRFWESKRYQAHKIAAAGVAARQARVREDFAHKLSTRLVRQPRFHRDRETVPGPHDPARQRHWGRAETGTQSGHCSMPRSGRLAKCIEYKANLAEVTVIEVPAAYTSQRCHQCGHTCKGEPRKPSGIPLPDGVPGPAMLTPTPPSTCVRKPSRGGRRTPNNWLGHPVKSRAGSLPSARRGARVRPTPTRVRPLGRRHLR